MFEMLMARVSAIACGYEDAKELVAEICTGR
jgi:hypothetical protein